MTNIRAHAGYGIMPLLGRSLQRFRRRDCGKRKRGGRNDQTDRHKASRRNFLRLIAGIAVLLSVSNVVRAQALPKRPIRIIVGFSAGGVADLFARLIGQRLSERLGQPVIVENRVGAGSNLATESVVRAAPDGHTLLLVTTANAINQTLYGKLNFDFARDIVPIASIVRGIGVLEVHPSFPARTIPEFIAYAKANPGTINYASAGIGSAQFVYAELFKVRAGIDMAHVPYRGGEAALTDLLAGRISVMFDTLATSIDHIRAGKLRALGVTDVVRSEALPNVPAIAEFLPGFEATGWTGLGAPRNTPDDTIERLNEEINACLSDPEIKARITDLGYSVFVSSQGEFSKLIADEIEKWGKVIRAGNIKVE